MAYVLHFEVIYISLCKMIGLWDRQQQQLGLTRN